MAGITDKDNLQQANDKLKAIGATLAELGGDQQAQKALQDMIDARAEFTDGFITPLEQAMGTLKASELDKFLTDNLGKAGDNIKDVVDKIAKDMGPEFEALAPEFDKSTDSAHRFLMALKDISGLQFNNAADAAKADAAKAAAADAADAARAAQIAQLIKMIEEEK
jgi:hypothetical protein